MHRPHFISILISLLLVVPIIAGQACIRASADDGTQMASPTPFINPSPQSSAVEGIYLPVVQSPTAAPPAVGDKPRVNMPYFPEALVFDETAVFWFGRVNLTENYSDVRVGYTREELFVHLGIFDRLVWYDASPSASDLEAWDAGTLFLDLDGDNGNSLDAKTYRFTGQVNALGGGRAGYQAAYRGAVGGWEPISVPFTTETGFRGSANDGDKDNGWRLTYHIPFSSLGLSGPPPQGTIWGLGVVLHDRDDAGGEPIADQVWPARMEIGRSKSWGQLVFGLPSYTPPPLTPDGSVTIRHKQNGVIVEDAGVGGGTNCAKGMDYFTEWGQANYSGVDRTNVQNQYDVADWPCFSKFYITFPLDSIPAGKTILTATLTLHHFGNSGGDEWGEAPGSWIQVMTVGGDWEEATLTWNNAPLAMENVGRSWVEWLPEYPGWPGIPRSWDISRAVAEAYGAGIPLRLALYSADSARHSGKYFLTSDVDDHSVEGRPFLVVTWAEP